MDINDSHFGARVREIRRARNITQKQLAERIGVSVSFIGHIERGFRKISIDNLTALCKALDITADDLLHDRPKDNLPDRFQSEILMSDPEFVRDVLELAQKIILRWDTLCAEKANLLARSNEKNTESKEEHDEATEPTSDR